MGDALHFFHPRQAGFRTLEALFVGRQQLLAELFVDLKRQSSSKSRQHWLLRGPRGIGKTHLTALLYHNVLADPVLASAYLPVWLPETASISAYGLDHLLLQMGEELAMQLGESEGPTLMQRLAAVEGEAGSPELFEGALEVLRTAAEERGKILLVLLENLDVLLGTLTDRRGKAETTHLRALLLGEPRLLFVSTTTALELPALESSGQPLFAQFRERRLHPLTEEEVGELLTKLAQVAGNPASPSPLDRQRRRVFHRLTGGNPRAISLGFAAASGAEDIAGLVSEMEHLLDAQTPYFEARLTALAPRERAIVEALGLALTNLTQQEIASRTRLPVQQLSTQVQRLRDAGIVAPADGEGGKGMVYELTDGLFRVWMQYRRGKGVLAPLVRFVALWYQPEEIKTSLMDLEMIEGGPLALADLRRTVRRQLEAALAWSLSDEGRREREQLWAQAGELDSSPERVLPDELRALVVRALEEKELKALLGAAAEVEAWLSSPRSLEEEVGAARLLNRLGGGLTEAQELESGLSVYDSVARRFATRSELALAERAASALFLRASALEGAGLTEEALAACEDVDCHFRTRPELSLVEVVAATLLRRGMTLSNAGRIEECLTVFAEVTQRFGSRQESSLLQFVAAALLGRGAALAGGGHFEESLAANMEVDHRLSGRPEPELLQLAAAATLGAGACAWALGRADEALVLFERTLYLAGEQTEPVVEHVVGTALASRAELIGEPNTNAWFSDLGDLLILRPSVLAIAARGALENLRSPAVRAALEPLLSGQDEVAAVARQWALVADVLAAEESAGNGSPGSRRRKALARVPPELRQTVEEAAEAIAKTRRERAEPQKTSVQAGGAPGQ